MIIEEKDIELLLKEFSMRLPYGVVFNAFGKDEKLKELSTIIAFANGGLLNDKYAIQHCKPYLCPMSSMTEEEWQEYQTLKMTDWVECDINEVFINAGTITDWLNANHFDYRGLIPKGLAIAVTKENNPYKD